MEQNKEYVYEFLYNDCIHESSYAIISTHKTLKGAYNAMRKFIYGSYLEWNDERIRFGKSKGEKPFYAERWRINKKELLD